MTPAIESAAIVATLAAHAMTCFVLLAFMQTATREAGWRCPLAALYLLHRLFYLLLICALAANAEYIYATWELPSAHDLAVEIAFFALSAFSYARHRSAPMIPNGASWRHPAGPKVHEMRPLQG